MPKRRKRKSDDPTIGEFVDALAKDDALARRFDKFPIRTMKTFKEVGLSQARINKIMSGDIVGLRTQIESDLNRKSLVFRVKRG